MQTNQEDANVRQKSNDARQQEIFEAKQAALKQAATALSPIQQQPFGAIQKQAERG